MSCSFGLAPAHSSATLTGEYRTAASDLLNAIHLETISEFLPRETSMRISESTRTVIACAVGPNDRCAADPGHTPPRPERRSAPCGYRRIPASPSFADPGTRESVRERP